MHTATLLNKRDHLLCILASLLCSSCSFITTVGILEQTEKSDWQETGKGYSYAFTHLSTPAFGLCEDSLYVLLCPCPKPGRNILIGPPFIPAVPNLYQIFWDPKPNERFFVDVQFINQTGRQRELDLSRVVFEGKNKALVPTNLCAIENEYFGQHRRSYPQMQVFSGFADSARVNLPPQGTLIVRYEFETKASSVKKLGVSIEGISDLITMPTLRLKKRTKVIYMPLFDG